MGQKSLLSRKELIWKLHLLVSADKKLQTVFSQSVTPDLDLDYLACCMILLKED